MIVERRADAARTSPTAVFFSSEIVTLNDADLDMVMAMARNAPKGRARLCLHKSLDEPVQDMVIALTAGHPIPPHRQLGRRKTYYLLRGCLRVRFHDAVGTVMQEVILGGNGSFVLTFPAGEWHSLDALSPDAVYVEVAAGPVLSTTTEWLKPVV